MKKYFYLLVITVVSLSSSAIAQEVSFGLKGGVSFANLAGGEIDRNNLITFHAGLFSEFELSDSFAIQPELLYSRQGSDLSNDLVLQLDYLTIPVMAKYYLSDKLSLEAGPQFAFLTNDTFKLESGDEDTSDLELETDAASFDFVLGIGAAYEMSAGTIVQVRYNYGVTTVSESPDINNSVLQLSIGYKF